MINISKKSDIVIPFSKIGDEGWAMKSESIARSVLSSWGTSFDEIDFELKTDEELNELESRIEATLPDGFRLFCKTFGVADIGEELQEFDMIGRLSEIWDVNEQAYQGPDFSKEELAIFPHLVSFSDHLCSGNMFCFHDETKEIYYVDNDAKPHITKMFDSVDDYIRGCLINCQIDLFDMEIGQDKVEKWIEEVMIDTFGKEIYQKWYF